MIRAHGLWINVRHLFASCIQPEQAMIPAVDIQDFQKHPDGYLHFVFGRETQNREQSLKCRIKVDIPPKCGHCRVVLSREWVISPPSEWVQRRKQIRETEPARRLGLYTGESQISPDWALPCGPVPRKRT
jgi:hypothetical protein